MNDTERYDTVAANDLGTLREGVNDRIKDGWEPRGGICYSPEDGFYCYIQAVFKPKRTQVAVVNIVAPPSEAGQYVADVMAGAMRG